MMGSAQDFSRAHFGTHREQIVDFLGRHVVKVILEEIMYILQVRLSSAKIR